MNKCKCIDICSKNCNKECKAYKMYTRRKITRTICYIVGTISALLVMGFAGSLECDAITIKQFVAMSVLPMVLAIASIEVGNMIKEEK